MLLSACVAALTQNMCTQTLRTNTLLCSSLERWGEHQTPGETETETDGTTIMTVIGIDATVTALQGMCMVWSVYAVYLCSV